MTLGLEASFTVFHSESVRNELGDSMFTLGNQITVVAFQPVQLAQA